MKRAGRVEFLEFVVTRNSRGGWCIPPSGACSNDNRQTVVGIMERRTGPFDLSGVRYCF
jgi:hypothetical protein